MSAGGTGGDDCQIGALHVVHNRQVAANHVDNGAGHKERGHFARTCRTDDLIIAFDRTNTADARANSTPNPGAILISHLKTAILQRLNAGNHAELNEGIHPLGILRMKVALRGKLFY